MDDRSHPCGSGRNARRLKVGGLVCLALAIPAIVAPGERLTTVEWVASADTGRMMWVAAVWVAGCNLLALGLVLMLAGLHDVPLLTSAHARHGAWTKMAGANLLILCFAYAGFGDAGTLPPWLTEGWGAAPALALFVLAARSGIMLVRTGWKYEAVSAERLMAEDPRPPIVYLRSFQDDRQILVTPPGGFGRFGPIWRFLPPFYLTAVSPEQELALYLSRLGPVVAIGRPGERLPELGAARLYVADDAWRDRISDLIRRARIVIIRAGVTPNLWWEIDQAMRVVARDRVVLVNLSAAAGAKDFDRMFAERFGAPEVNTETEPSEVPAWLRQLIGAGDSNVSAGSIIFFDGGGHPRAELITVSMTWSGLAMSMGRPYRDTLQSALTRVVRRMGIEPLPGRSQTTAVLLALFGGLVGLHHFYLGSRRRGFWYLALAPIGVSALLGWADAVRLLMPDERQFARAHSGVPGAPS